MKNLLLALLLLVNTAVVAAQSVSAKSINTKLTDTDTSVVIVDSEKCFSGDQDTHYIATSALALSSIELTSPLTITAKNSSLTQPFNFSILPRAPSFA